MFCSRQASRSSCLSGGVELTESTYTENKEGVCQFAPQLEKQTEMGNVKENGPSEESAAMM